MCRFCEESCWRDGGERECTLSDAEFEAASNGDSLALCFDCGAVGPSATLEHNAECLRGDLAVKVYEVTTVLRRHSSKAEGR